MQMQSNSTEQLIWEWPLRCWHWLFALCVTGSLATGLSGDIGLMEWHLRLGYCVLGLLLFRVLWGFVGGTYSRWVQYRPSWSGIVTHFRGGVDDLAHTAPGIGLTLFLLVVVLLQALSGLFTTDDIFVEGPLVRSASDDLVSAMTAQHHRVFWLVIAAIAIHLTAHVVYSVRGSRMSLSMFTGRKPVRAGVVPTQASGLRALGSAGLVLLLVWGFLELMA